MLIAALPCLTDVSVEPQHSTGGRTKSQVCKSSSSTSAICRRLFHHNTGFVFHTCSQLSKKPANLCSPHARSPWDENLGLLRLLHLLGQHALPAPSSAAEQGCGAAEQFPWSPWFHFSSEADHLTSSLFEHTTQLYCKAGYNVCCTGQRCCTRKKQHRIWVMQVKDCSQP